MEQKMPSRMSQSFVQCWVNTGYLPSCHQEHKADSTNSDISVSLSEGQSIVQVEINTVLHSGNNTQQNNSILKSSSCSVDTTAYILSNINKTGRKEITNAVTLTNHCSATLSKRQLQPDSKDFDNKKDISEKTIEKSKFYTKQEQSVIDDMKDHQSTENDSSFSLYLSCQDSFEKVRRSTNEQLEDKHTNNDKDQVESPHKSSQNNERRCSNNSTNKLSELKKLYTARDSPIEVLDCTKKRNRDDDEEYFHPALSLGPNWLNTNMIDESPMRSKKRKKRVTSRLSKFIAKNDISDLSKSINECIDSREDLQSKENNTAFIKEKNNSSLIISQTNQTPNSTNSRTEQSCLIDKKQVKQFPLANIMVDKCEVKSANNCHNKKSFNQSSEERLDNSKTEGIIPEIHQPFLRLKRLSIDELNVHLKIDEYSTETVEDDNTYTFENTDNNSVSTIQLYNDKNYEDSDLSTICIVNRDEFCNGSYGEDFVMKLIDLCNSNKRGTLLSPSKTKFYQERLFQPIVLLKRLSTFEIEEYSKRSIKKYELRSKQKQNVVEDKKYNKCSRSSNSEEQPLDDISSVQFHAKKSNCLNKTTKVLQNNMLNVLNLHDEDIFPNIAKQKSCSLKSKVNNCDDMFDKLLYNNLNQSKNVTTLASSKICLYSVDSSERCQFNENTETKTNEEKEHRKSKLLFTTSTRSSESEMSIKEQGTKISVNNSSSESSESVVYNSDNDNGFRSNGLRMYKRQKKITECVNNNKLNTKKTLLENKGKKEIIGKEKQENKIKKEKKLKYNLRSKSLEHQERSGTLENLRSSKLKTSSSDNDSDITNRNVKKRRHSSNLKKEEKYSCNMISPGFRKYINNILDTPSDIVSLSHESILFNTSEITTNDLKGNPSFFATDHTNNNEAESVCSTYSIKKTGLRRDINILNKSLTETNGFKTRQSKQFENHNLHKRKNNLIFSTEMSSDEELV